MSIGARLISAHENRDDIHAPGFVLLLAWGAILKYAPLSSVY